MESTENSSGGFGFVVLDKIDTGEELLKVVEVVAFFEITAGVGVNSRFDK